MLASSIGDFYRSGAQSVSLPVHERLPISENWLPRALQKIGLTANTVAFRWEAPSSQAAIEYSHVRLYSLRDFKYVFEDDVNTTEILVEGLEPYEKYRIYVSSCPISSPCGDAVTQEFRTAVAGDCLCRL